MRKSLHIVSFDNPYPPNYGGIIDVFYKIKSLNDLGISIHLHILSNNIDNHTNLKKICFKVYNYERINLFFSLFSYLPFRVKRRFNNKLIQNLLNVKAPIIFEGLHSTAVLLKNNFPEQNIFLRAHNIEHNYIKGLSNSTTNIAKQLFFKIEAFKFKKYEKIIDKLHGILSIAYFEHIYFLKTYKASSYYIPPFHENSTFYTHKSIKNNVLYHGDLRVDDNIKSCLFLIDTLKNSKIQFDIASSTINDKIIKGISGCQNIQFIKIKNNDQLTNLIYDAHINALPTFQKTGIKLKLVNALYKGKFVLVNSKMVDDTGLEDLCEIANSKKEFLTKIKVLLKTEFNQNHQIKRKEKLIDFNTKKNAQKIIDIIFK